jgi:HEAT repeat protein
MHLISLLAGALVASLLAVLIYTQRDRLGALRRTVETRTTSTRERLLQGVDAVYREAIVEMANAQHAAGHLVPLEQIAVLPQFYTLPSPFDPLDTEKVEYDRPQHLIPRVIDWPHMLGPYHLPSVGLDEILLGDANVAILGLPGSGRTVALCLMAVLAARQTSVDQDGGILPRLRLPVYVDLPDVDFDSLTDHDEVDPLGLLLEAERSRLSGIGGHLMGTVRESLADGLGLLLIDGWDELSTSQAGLAAAWLEGLMQTYPGNQIVVAGSIEGYRPLQALGFALAFILPWGEPHYAELAERWAAVWTLMNDDLTPPADDLIRRAAHGNRTRSPLDVTLRIWATYADDDPGERSAGWYRAYVQRLVPQPEPVGILRRVAKAVVLDAEKGGLARHVIPQLIEEEMRHRAASRTVSAPDFVDSMVNAGLLVKRAGNRIGFRHPVVGAFLAAEALSREDAPHLELLYQKYWRRLVMPFLAQMQDITPYVEQQLAVEATVLATPQLELARWAVDVEQNGEWRGQVFARLADMLLSPAEFPLIQERTTAALVASRDPNVAYVFQEGLNSSDPHLQTLCVFGLGALGDIERLLALGEVMEVEGVAPTVEVAAGLALGAVGTERALHYMIQMLLGASDLTRRAVAEMLAATNTAGEGHDVLREAADEMQPATRKAAIYGLARIDEPWADEMIADLERHDDQWLVRAAAGAVMDRRREGLGSENVPEPSASPERIAWLVYWLEQQGESGAPGPQGVAQLVRALQEGDDATRLAAAETLGALGLSEGIRPLYGALRDPHPEIRDAAYRALGAIGLASGHDLPDVVHAGG